MSTSTIPPPSRQIKHCSSDCSSTVPSSRILHDFPVYTRPKVGHVAAMLRFIGQITVTLVARDRHTAQARLRTFAKQLAACFSDVVFADHHGEIENYGALTADGDGRSNRIPFKFDRFEIGGVAPAMDDHGAYFESVDDSEAEMWYLYGHIPGQGLMTIGKYVTRIQAELILAALTGRPASMPVPQQLRMTTAA